MFAALFAAIICVATIVVQIPTPATNGFFNLGDCFVIIAGQLLGVGFGALAAGHRLVPCGCLCGLCILRTRHIRHKGGHGRSCGFDL